MNTAPLGTNHHPTAEQRDPHAKTDKNKHEPQESRVYVESTIELSVKEKQREIHSRPPKRRVVLTGFWNMVRRMPPPTNPKSKPQPASLLEEARVETTKQLQKCHLHPALWVPTTILVDANSVTSEITAVSRKPEQRKLPPPPPFRDIVVAVKETNKETNSQAHSTLTGTCLPSHDDVHHKTEKEDFMGDGIPEDDSSYRDPWAVPRDYSPLTVGDDEYF